MSTKFFVKTNLVRHVVAHQQVVSCWCAQALVSITFGVYQVMLCVRYGSQKSYGTICCSTVATTLSRTRLTIVNCIEAMQIIDFMSYARWQFFCSQKTFHVHMSWIVSGRKLPTAYTSQQLLSGVGQSDIFFQFFCSQKTQKNRYTKSSKLVFGTHLETSDFMSGKSRNCTILDTKKVEILDTRNRTFWTNPEKSRNLRNLQKSQKSAKSRKIAKIAKISKISKIPKISRFWHSEGYHTDLVRIAIRSTFWPLSRTCPEGQICCPEAKILVSRKSKKSAKFCEILTPQKIENLSWLPWRSTRANGGRNRSPEAKK